MSKSTPSLIALLGLVAVAGYQNRARISEMLSDARQAPQDSPPGAAHADQSQRGGFLSEIGNLFGGGAAGGTLSSGLGDLISRFREPESCGWRDPDDGCDRS